MNKVVRELDEELGMSEAQRKAAEAKVESEKTRADNAKKEKEAAEAESYKLRQQFDVLAIKLNEAEDKVKELESERDRIEAELESSNLWVGILESELLAARNLADGWEYGCQATYSFIYHMCEKMRLKTTL